jgi:hypothetical protein
MRSDKSGRTVGTFFGWSAELRSTPRQIASIRRTSNAVMLPIATATRRKARRFGRTQREQRRDNREAKDSQQQDGKQRTQ